MIWFGMMPNQRDILLIPIPFTDLSSMKRRPVLVLSNNHYNSISTDVVVTAITSNLLATDYGLVIGQQHLEEGTLQQQSLIRCDKIYTLSQKIVLKRFGRLNKNSFSLVLDMIQSLFN